MVIDRVTRTWQCSGLAVALVTVLQACAPASPPLTSVIGPDLGQIYLLQDVRYHFRGTIEGGEEKEPVSGTFRLLPQGQVEFEYRSPSGGCSRRQVAYTVIGSELTVECRGFSLLVRQDGQGRFQTIAAGPIRWEEVFPGCKLWGNGYCVMPDPYTVLRRVPGRGQVKIVGVDLPNGLGGATRLNLPGRSG